MGARMNWKDINKEQPPSCADDGIWMLAKNDAGFHAAVNCIAYAFRQDGNRWEGWVITPEESYCPISGITRWAEIC